MSRNIFYNLSHNITCFTRIHINPSIFPILGKLLIIVPVSICGCSRMLPAEVPISVGVMMKIQNSSTLVSECSTLDIFTFENDRQQRLDSYQRHDRISSAEIGVTSTGGNKIVFVCADGQRSRYDWKDIKSYSSLGDVHCTLDKESLDQRVMTGEAEIKAGESDLRLTLSPLTSEIVLEAIYCDFSGTPYSSSVIKDAKVYLTNVSASCPLLYTEGSRPTRIINSGMLMASDLRNFKSQDIIVQHIADILGRDTIFPDIKLLCYPNPGNGESPGCPDTKIVIEGKIEGETYYWPIRINKEKGIEKGCRYYFDICIRRRGVTEPDIEFEPESAVIQIRIRPWEEKDEYIVGF